MVLIEIVKMSNIVIVEHGMLLTDSQIIAKEFGMKHNKVMDLVGNMVADFPHLRGSGITPNSSDYLRIEPRHYKGTNFNAAVMNEQTFALLMMRFTTPRARVKQVEFRDQFYAMRDALMREQSNKADSQWLAARDQGKLARREETDVIKQFVDYATAQGSKNAKFYYKHITTATYRAMALIESEKPKLRETMGWLEITQLSMGEVVAARSLQKHMADGVNYKTIFELVKNDLERFAESCMVGQDIFRIDRARV